MRRLSHQNANSSLEVSQTLSGSSGSSSRSNRKANTNWRVYPSDFVPRDRNMNGHLKPSSTKSTNSLDPKNLAAAATLLGSVGSLAAAETTERVGNGGITAVEEDIYAGHDFPFENLVFEGGGNKGMAYVGVLQILESAGVMKKIRRVAGASAGAIIAALIALGFDSQELKEFLEQDLRKILVDHNCGYCSLLPNLLKGFGWNPGKKLLKWFGEQIKERAGDADVTFREVLERFGKELCIVVTNLNQMSVEYFHPKTTPNTPIRKAIRMSVALPGVFQCVREINNDYEDVYVDGGLLCNYPIHAFDGWWLSMDPKHTFFKKLQPLEDFARLFEKSERFGEWNHKTLGIVLYSHTETELMKTLLTEREGNHPPDAPNTKLARQRWKLKQQQLNMRQEHQAMVGAVGRFMKELQRNNLDEDSIINLRELRGVFTKPVDFTREDAELLFGYDVDYRSAFEELDTDEDGEITFQELMAFIEKRGVNLQTRFLGYSRKEIRHLGEFIQTLQTALSVNVKRVYVEKRDVERTIGIDTDYIETNDFQLEQGDKDFLIESGRRATRAFLREYYKKKYPAVTPSQTDQEPVRVSVRGATPAVTSDRKRNPSVVSDISITSNKLPPLSAQYSHEKSKSTVTRHHRYSSAGSAGSESSTTSTGKVSVDVPKSPSTGRKKSPGRKTRVGALAKFL
ncbi:uncharacterized protein LOC116302953 [Actinia tenebrosa]|uniref:Uncharacterized protein LOC116302953 n=1 Tax=Actinia tenebrosa TaxID=6105 RepID=A0A6P8IPE7_ACTTE|nr:uncharacterized protein LOC116302953 [Actinia tenebrosa]